MHRLPTTGPSFAIMLCRFEDMTPWNNTFHWWLKSKAVGQTAFGYKQLLSHWLMVRPFHWCHNDHDGVSNHQPHGCLLNRLFRRRSKKTSKLRVNGLSAGNSPRPVNSPHKGPVTWKMLPFDDVIMQLTFQPPNWVTSAKRNAWIPDWWVGPPYFAPLQILHQPFLQ